MMVTPVAKHPMALRNSAWFRLMMFWAFVKQIVSSEATILLRNAAKERCARRDCLHYHAEWPPFSAPGTGSERVMYHLTVEASAAPEHCDS
jgi:hypothetical protein